MSDLIDRQELLKHKGNCYDEEGHLLYAVGTGTILLMPTVDAEPVRHGHWETVFMSEATGYDPTLANYIDPVFCHRCSVCKEDARLDEFGEEMISKYCPNCGAKMDEVEDAETD